MSVDGDYPSAGVSLSSGYPNVGAGLNTNTAADDILGGLSSTGSYGVPASQKPTVLRGRVREEGTRTFYGGRTAPEPGMPSQRSARTMITRDQRASLEEYNAEFWDRWEDPMFQQWLRSRLIASGKYKNPTTEQAYVAWVNLGEQAAGAQGWKGTPEQMLEFWASGVMKSTDEVAADMRSGALVMGPDGQVVDEANPIQTHTSTAYTSINPLAANAAIDQLSQALLGRMANESEMARYRKAMNKILRSNPTVTTNVQDATDPDNVVSTSTTKDGASASDAEAAIQMRMQRGSEGMAFNAGKMIEQAMRMMG